MVGAAVGGHERELERRQHHGLELGSAQVGTWGGVLAGTGVPATYRLRTSRNTNYNISRYLGGIRVVRWTLSIDFCTGTGIDKKQDFMFHRFAQLARGFPRLPLGTLNRQPLRRGLQV